MTASDTLSSYIKDRIKVSELIYAVITSKISVLDALKEFPKNLGDPTLNAAFHALIHFEADEELRKNDADYKDEQDLYLADIAEILSQGHALPYNIIEEYEKYHKDSLVYPNIDKKTVFRRLKKMINL